VPKGQGAEDFAALYQIYEEWVTNKFEPDGVDDE